MIVSAADVIHQDLRKQPSPVCQPVIYSIYLYLSPKHFITST